MPTRKNVFKHNIIAFVYDFDGTLTPQPMQDYTILPEIGIKKPAEFWRAVNKETRRTGGEQILTYMRMMIEKAHAIKEYAVTESAFRKLAKNIEYFPGVERYFRRINKYATDLYDGEIELRHYIISAGLKEIISSTKIAKYFHKIFACEYHYNQYGCPTFPKVIINDTLKTQFIFRINKGREELSENINQYMHNSLRPIPFQNILYIGDGLTDVPCMRVVRMNGGFAIAVFSSNRSEGYSICKELLGAERVDYMAKADFQAGSDLDRMIKLLLNHIVSGIRYGKESFNQKTKYLTWE